MKAMVTGWCLLLPLLAQADVTGVYQITDEQRRDAGTLTIQMKDDRHVRWEMRERKDAAVVSSMLMLGDKLYTITPEGEVMDMSAMGALMGGRTKSQSVPGSVGQDKGESFRIDPAGRTETVAGIKGEVYRWTGGGQSGEVVLSDDGRAKALARAMERMGERLDQAFEGRSYTPPLHDAPALRNKGVLSSNEQNSGGMRLVRVDEAAIPPERFVLPAKPTALPKGIPAPGSRPDMSDPKVQQMMREMMQQYQQQQQQQQQR
ncbi:MAG: hypothetical protein ACOZAQ_00975 [Pseudomonadota bacterium]